MRCSKPATSSTFWAIAAPPKKPRKRRAFTAAQRRQQAEPRLRRAFHWLLFRLRIRVGGFFEHHPSTTNKDAGECKNGGHKSRDSPHRLHKPVESAKMQLRQQFQAVIREAFVVDVDW
jgi:hypothetical protein